MKLPSEGMSLAELEEGCGDKGTSRRSRMTWGGQDSICDVTKKGKERARSSPRPPLLRHGVSSRWFPGKDSSPRELPSNRARRRRETERW
ncbi:Hypothetical protein SMAX5B_005065, partial [Scophthalmus maximus]